MKAEQKVLIGFVWACRYKPNFGGWIYLGATQKVVRIAVKWRDWPQNLARGQKWRIVCQVKPNHHHNYTWVVGTHWRKESIDLPESIEVTARIFWKWTQNIDAQKESHKLFRLARSSGPTQQSIAPLVQLVLLLAIARSCGVELNFHACGGCKTTTQLNYWNLDEGGLICQQCIQSVRGYALTNADKVLLTNGTGKRTTSALVVERWTLRLQQFLLERCGLIHN